MSIVMLSDVIWTLQKHDISSKDIEKCIDQLRVINLQSIRWTTDDFIQAAKDKHHKEWEKFYEKESFEDALEIMIEQHDATYGINWDTVNYYLEEYCKKVNTNDE